MTSPLPPPVRVEGWASVKIGFPGWLGCDRDEFQNEPLTGWGSKSRSRMSLFRNLPGTRLPPSKSSRSRCTKSWLSRDRELDRAHDWSELLTMKPKARYSLMLVLAGMLLTTMLVVFIAVAQRTDVSESLSMESSANPKPLGLTQGDGVHRSTATGDGNPRSLVHAAAPSGPSTDYDQFVSSLRSGRDLPQALRAGVLAHLESRRDSARKNLAALGVPGSLKQATNHAWTLLQSLKEDAALENFLAEKFFFSNQPPPTPPASIEYVTVSTGEDVVAIFPFDPATDIEVYEARKAYRSATGAYGQELAGEFNNLLYEERRARVDSHFEAEKAILALLNAQEPSWPERRTAIQALETRLIRLPGFRVSVDPVMCTIAIE